MPRRINNFFQLDRIIVDSVPIVKVKHFSPSLPSYSGVAGGGGGGGVEHPPLLLK